MSLIPLNRSTVREYVLTELGYPTVEVELVDTQIDQCIDKTLKLFNEYLYWDDLQLTHSYGTEDDDSNTVTMVSLGVTTVVVDLPEGVRGVKSVQVLFPSTITNLENMSDFEYLARAMPPRFANSDWVIFKQHFEMTRRIRGVDPDWRLDETNKKLYIATSGGNYDIQYVLTRDFDIASLGASQNSNLQNSFLMGVVANAKMILSMIRGKFAGIQTAAGTLSLDASDLRQQAQMELEKVEEKLQDYRQPLSAIIG